MGFVRRRARRRALLVGGGLAYEAGKNRGQDQGDQGYQEEQAVPPAPPPPAPTEVPSGTSDVENIQRLADLHTSGALTDEEFAAEKAKILGI